jgi:hypothetical protein
MKSELLEPFVDTTIDFNKACLVQYVDICGDSGKYIVLVSPKTATGKSYNFSGTVVYSENKSFQIGDIHDSFGKSAFTLFTGKIGIQN